MPAPPANMIDVTVPDLDLGTTPVFVSVWHCKTGQTVIEGDRLVELFAGDVIIDLPAPATGKLAAQEAQEDDPVAAGQVIGRIAASPDETL